MWCKLYRSFVVVMFVVMAYALGALTGYAVGYNDNLAERVAEYRCKNMKRR